MEEEEERRLVIVIAGPTAVGKSDAALAIAEALGAGRAELVSADSVQVYTKLDIGSNKPSLAEQALCPTHLIDWLDPKKPCTVAQWTKEALRVIDEIHEGGKLPIVVGGSCMYLDWLVHGEGSAGKSDPQVREEVQQGLRPFQELMDWEGAVALLSVVDAEQAAKLSRNNWRMLARHLEVAHLPRHRVGRASRVRYDFRSFFLCPQDRRTFLDRIDRRCLAMMQAGLLQEVAGLLQNRTFEDLTSSPALAIGYRQTIEYLTRPGPQLGDVKAFEDFVRGFGSATRNYARTQVQWFTKDPAFLWLPADPYNPKAVAAEILRLTLLPEDECRAAAAALDSDSRQAWRQTADGGEVPLFRSGLERPQDLFEGTGRGSLPELLKLADACTGRVPPAFRRIAEAAAPVVDLPRSPDSTPYGRVFWGGKHQTWGWGNPLSKMHKQGLQLLETCGWQAVQEKDASLLPVFCWPTRKAANFPAAGGDGPLPLVRPFPQSFSDRLDDKALLMVQLRAAGQAAVQPPTWTAEEFLQEEEKSQAQKTSVVEETVEAPAPELLFLKHSLGVKGNGIHVFAGRESLRQRLQEMGTRSCRNFIVQLGVAPPALDEGRKSALRVHALLHYNARDGPHVYCHDAMIVLKHGQAYTPEASVRSAHISSAGHQKHWPKPTLLEDVRLKEQIRDLTARTMASVWEHLPPLPLSPPEAELCQVFGLDFAADAGGRAWLLEVNSYPAIASGTMAHVDAAVYTDLVRDVLRLVVLPVLEGAPRQLGGFVELDVRTKVTILARK